MNIGTELLKYIFCKHTVQKILKIQWGLNPLTLPLVTPVKEALQHCKFLA